METAASFEVRNAPSSYPTAAGNGGYRQGDPKSADRLFPYSALSDQLSLSSEVNHAPSDVPLGLCEMLLQRPLIHTAHHVRLGQAQLVRTTSLIASTAPGRSLAR